MISPKMYDKAILLKEKCGGVSIPLLQMKLNVSYAKAKLVVEAINASDIKTIY